MLIFERKYIRLRKKKFYFIFYSLTIYCKKASIPFHQSTTAFKSFKQFPTTSPIVKIYRLQDPLFYSTSSSKLLRTKEAIHRNVLKK